MRFMSTLLHTSIDPQCRSLDKQLRTPSTLHLMFTGILSLRNIKDERETD